MSLPRAKLHRCAAVLLTASLSLLALLVVSEIYLRSSGFMRTLPPGYPCIAPDLTLNHVFRPNCLGKIDPVAMRVPQEKIWTTNSLGLRMREWDEQKPTLLLLGDSYVEGFGLANEENLPAQLEKRLPGWQVGNGGVMGYSNVLYPLLWREKFFAKKEQIKYVLVNLDFSDFNENLYYLSISRADKSAVQRIFPATEIFPKWTLGFVYSNYSALLRLVHQEINRWVVSRLAKKNRGVLNAALAGAPLFPAAPLKKWGMEKCWAGMELTVRSLRDLSIQLRQDGIAMGVHMYPTGAQVRAYPKKKLAISEMETLDLGEANKMKCAHSLAVMELMQHSLEKMGIDFYQSREIILNHVNRESLYFPDDAHWNERGVALVANKLAAKLKPKFPALKNTFSRESN